MKNSISEKEINDLYENLDKEAKEGGYNLNPDTEFTKELVESLIINEKRYGYRACPCRLASGNKDEDLDIICPCDYRDPDLNEHSTCYCALYVSSDVVSGEKEIGSIPERRPPKEKRAGIQEQKKHSISALPLPVWRCSVCGHLCARQHPPEVCPICRAKKDRFEEFM